ncbi:MAG TPA: hypothetical protein VN541_12170, partial [Tepidisphaeraceae bacterium]|nr:hypothetical protein [Tepidisphaeraceae bacterium]
MATTSDNQRQLWFLTGSQHLYGPEALRQVANNSEQLVYAVNGFDRIPIKLASKPVLTGPEEVTKACHDANSDPNCVGVVLWMHTFSPARMWINGLRAL